MTYPQPEVFIWEQHKEYAGWVDSLVEHMPKARRIEPINPTRSWARSVRQSGLNGIAYFDENWPVVPDVVLTTSGTRFTDVYYNAKTFWEAAPYVLYMHGTDFSYPEHARDYSILFEDFHKMQLAQKVVWYAEGMMLDALNGYEDYFNSEFVQRIQERSLVIPPIVNYSALEDNPDEIAVFEEWSDDRPILLWNHRMQTDKQPALFFRAVRELYQQGADFGLIIAANPTGIKFAQVYNELKEAAGDRLLHSGHVHDKKQYAGLVRRADVVVCCSRSIDFPRAVVEAMSAGLTAVLPNQNTYRRELSESEAFFYEPNGDNVDTLVAALKEALTPGAQRERKQPGWFQKFRVENVAEELYEVCKDVYEEVVGRAAMERSKKIEEIAALIHDKGEATAQQILTHLGWGGADYWAQYHYGLRHRGFDREGDTYSVGTSSRPVE